MTRAASLHFLHKILPQKMFETLKMNCPLDNVCVFML